MGNAQKRTQISAGNMRFDTCSAIKVDSMPVDERAARTELGHLFLVPSTQHIAGPHLSSVVQELRGHLLSRHLTRAGDLHMRGIGHASERCVSMGNPWAQILMAPPCKNRI